MENTNETNWAIQGSLDTIFAIQKRIDASLEAHLVSDFSGIGHEDDNDITGRVNPDGFHMTPMSWDCVKKFGRNIRKADYHGPIHQYVYSFPGMAVVETQEEREKKKGFYEWSLQLDVNFTDSPSKLVRNKILKGLQKFYGDSKVFEENEGIKYSAKTRNSEVFERMLFLDQGFRPFLQTLAPNTKYGVPMENFRMRENPLQVLPWADPYTRRKSGGEKDRYDIEAGFVDELSHKVYALPQGTLTTIVNTHLDLEGDEKSTCRMGVSYVAHNKETKRDLRTIVDTIEDLAGPDFKDVSNLSARLTPRHLTPADFCCR